MRRTCDTFCKSFTGSVICDKLGKCSKCWCIVAFCIKKEGDFLKICDVRFSYRVDSEVLDMHRLGYSFLFCISILGLFFYLVNYYYFFFLSELFSFLSSFFSLCVSFSLGGCIQIRKGGKSQLVDSLLGALLQVGSFIKLFSYFTHFPL